MLEPYLSAYGRPYREGAPAILFVPGAGMDHTVWALQGRHFAFHGWNDGHYDEQSARHRAIERHSALVWSQTDAN